jgi:hypothetical protein
LASFNFFIHGTSRHPTTSTFGGMARGAPPGCRYSPPAAHSISGSNRPLHPLPGARLQKQEKPFSNPITPDFNQKSTILQAFASLHFFLATFANPENPAHLCSPFEILIYDRPL